MWIGSLFDMGTKKLRATEGSEEDEAQSISGVKLSPLRVRGDEEAKPTVEKLEKFTCPNCFATNTKVGNCFNCGAVIEAAPVEIKREGFFIDKLPIKQISNLQEKYNISDRNTFIAFGTAGILLLFLLTSLFNSCQPARLTQAPTTQNNSKNAEQAVKLAVKIVGFKGIAPPGYWFEDTSSITNPLPSFGIYSDASNQKIIFVIFNDMSSVQALERFVQIPPFSDVISGAADSNEKAVKLTEGSQILGEGHFHYYVHTYPTANKVIKAMLVGSFPAKEPGKSVLVLGQALKEGNYDYKSTLFLVDAMAEPLTLNANEKRLAAVKEHNSSIGEPSIKPPEAHEQSTELPPASQQTTMSEKQYASEEELKAYYVTLEEKLKKKVEQSSELRDTIKKHKSGKLKVVLDVDINTQGHLRKMDIAEPDASQKVNDALVKAVKSLAPYGNVPKTENGLLNLRITLKKGGELKVEAR
jgi:hypothetical protein